ncbi:MAG: hypothetical protein GOMPHAMPRED_005247 [Gomphillus americanus]|uniref:Arrestin-like N-terminal domain-containing protein n=1 Tax=Gomphillus americanus TaxID=1940652 RepID=A0A8H3IRJ3_9LECA|nr:MAG: hypothetical protein GOMPHAMPRED_005247 [Gomphillus americanus]
MSAALVHQPRSSTSRALEKVSKGLTDLSNPSALIRTILPRLNGLNKLSLGLKQTPPNLVRAVLEKKSVCPGDTIRGTVRLMISETVPIEEVTVQIWGRSKTYAGLYNAVRTRIPFESYFELVNQSIKVEVEPKILTPKVYEFPFELDLPTTVTITEDDWPFDENTKRFNSNFTQPLPASFEAFSTAHAHVDCSIKYYVTVKLMAKDEKQTVQHRVPLTVRTSDARALMASNTINTCYMTCPFKFKLASSEAHLLQVQKIGMPTPGTSMESLSYRDVDASPSSSSSSSPIITPLKRNKFKELTRDNLLRFRLPEYSFDLNAEIPRSGRASEALPIVLKLSWSLVKSKKQITHAPPPMTLTSMKVSLQSRFMVRGVTKDNYNDVSLAVMADNASWHCIWRSAPILINELKDSIELGAETQTGDKMFVYPHKFLTAFKTFSIGREYVLTVLCNFTCAGELFQAKYEVDGFNILAEGDGDEDDFDLGKPKRYRRPAAYYDGDTDDEDEDGEKSASEKGEPEELNAEDEMFTRGGPKKPTYRTTIEDVNE